MHRVLDELAGLRTRDQHGVDLVVVNGSLEILRRES